jgi:hypothetical protein
VLFWLGIFGGPDVVAAEAGDCANARGKDSTVHAVHQGDDAQGGNANLSKESR